MDQKTQITKLLLATRTTAELTVKNIERMLLDLSGEKQALRQLVDEYNKERVRLFKQELHSRGMTWCTRGLFESHVAPKGEAKLLLVEGSKEYSHGYGNAYYGFRSFSTLHQACPACYENAVDKHGKKGSYDQQANGQESFYAFRVEKRADGYYARKFGEWIRLDDEEYKLEEPSSGFVERLAKEWGLPPKIEICYSSGFNDHTLIVRE